MKEKEIYLVAFSANHMKEKEIYLVAFFANHTV
jgi:hypothetical protein